MKVRSSKLTKRHMSYVNVNYLTSFVKIRYLLTLIICLLNGYYRDNNTNYTLSEAWSGVNWADLMAAQGAFGTDFYDR